MNTVDPTVRRETRYIALFTLILSVFMEGVFFLLRAWSYRVLLGNLLGGGAAVLNFFLMGLTVARSLSMEESDARKRIRASQGLRLLMEGALAAVGVVLFDPWATVIPLFFPRIAVMIRPKFDRIMGTEAAPAPENKPEPEPPDDPE